MAPANLRRALFWGALFSSSIAFRSPKFLGRATQPTHLDVDEARINGTISSDRDDVFQDILTGDDLEDDRLLGTTLTTIPLPVDRGSRQQLRRRVTAVVRRFLRLATTPPWDSGFNSSACASGRWSLVLLI